MVDVSSLPYRMNVGIVLFGPGRHVFVGKRAGIIDAWQLPQGGIDEGEAPDTAVFREMEEEIGTAQARILGEHPDWLQYDLPPELLGVAWGGKYRGQRQKWFALEFLGQDEDIRLDADSHPEFEAWKWVPLATLPALAVDFKRAIYERLARDFSIYAPD